MAFEMKANPLTPMTQEEMAAQENLVSQAALASERIPEDELEKTTKVMSECTGACCLVFTITISREGLREKKNGTTPIAHEAQVIDDMIIPLTRTEALRRMAEFKEPKLMRLLQRGEPLYKCRHWDEDSRKCLIYQERPTMCREYPYFAHCRICSKPTERGGQMALMDAKAKVDELLKDLGDLSIELEKEIAADWKKDETIKDLKVTISDLQGQIDDLSRPADPT